MRALAIALFYSVGTCIGGLAAPALFGRLIQAGRMPLAIGYLSGALLMVFAAVIEWRLGVDSEQKSLEDVTSPLSTAEPIPSAT